MSQGKDFYGVGAEVQEEVKVEDLNHKQRFFAFLPFIVAAIIAILFVLGVCKGDDKRYYLAGGILTCIEVTFIALAIYETISEENKKKTVTKIVLLTLPAIGYYIMAIIIAVQFVENKEFFGLMVGAISCLLFFAGPGIGMYIWYLKGKKKGQICCKPVMAKCVQVEEQRVLMNLSDDIKKSQYQADINKASLFTPSFQYDFEGTEYVSKLNMSVGNLNNIFEEGKEIKIYVNPTNPEEFVLEPLGNGFLSFMGILFIIFGIIFAAIIFIVAMRSIYIW